MVINTRYFFYIAFLIVALCSPACKNGMTGGDQISEGEIIYGVTYDPKNMMANLMPSEMKLKFKGDKIYSDLSTSMGLFTMTLIADSRQKKLVQLVKVLNDRKSVVYTQNDVKQMLDEEPKIKIEKLNETKEIAGYKCKKARITYTERKDLQGFDIYYTDRIKIKDANWYSPFKEIDGVILEYQISRYNIDMKLSAKAVTPSKVEDALFTVPGDYKVSTRKEIDEIFENM
jgi:GLPGLI family protein